jgi:parvulin-like peptidyl-prolyl isomerase
VTPEPVQTQFGWHIIRLSIRAMRRRRRSTRSRSRSRIASSRRKWQAYVDGPEEDAKIEKKL